MRTFSTARVAAIMTLVTLALAGCAMTSSGSSGSRHKIYESVEELVGDSTAVVVATALDQFREEAQMVTRVEVEEVLNPSGLATTGPAAATPLEPAQVLVVRQFRHDGEPGIETGSRYLLFLNPTMLEGPTSEHFYPAGAEAGIFRAEGDGFVRISTVDVDLPELLTVADLTR